MAGRLANETSPYLQQHAGNPVDWYPWGAEAFAAAKELKLPVLLSIGYSACHWCHVMARESFTDPQTAAYMNAHFINVKVDREERPDVDSIYMAALQALTGSGGWPLTAVLTAEGRPFFAGTYWPPEARHGLPAFRDVLQAVARAWRENPAEVSDTAADLSNHLQQRVQLSLSRGQLDASTTSGALELLLEQVDEVNFGFGAAPKFPPHSVLRFLLARPEPEAREVALQTISAMAKGGIFDQLGGGLSRYTVDAAWQVPHFEKMLFDTAQFIGLTASAFSLTHNEGFRQATLLAASFLSSELRAESGAFQAAISAESEGKEGEYYLWEHREFREVLGDSGLADFAANAFGVTEAGNFEGRNILTLSDAAWERADDPLLAEARQRLLAARSGRPKPETDHKILTSWNGLAIEGLALAGRLVQAPGLIKMAEVAAERFIGPLEAGSLRHSDSGQGPLLLEDLAFLGNGLLGLYQATLDPRHLGAASRAASQIAAEFSEAGNLYSTRASVDNLLLRPRELADAGAPADTAEAARLLLRIGRLTDDKALSDLAEATLMTAVGSTARQPQMLGSSLAAMDELLAPAMETVLFGDRESSALQSLASELQHRFLPHSLLLHESAGSQFGALLRGRASIDGQATAWLCLDRSCRLPVTDAAQLAAQIPGTMGARR